MPTPTNAQSPPAVMDLQDPEANSLVLDFLFRNSFNDIATEHCGIKVSRAGYSNKSRLYDGSKNFFAFLVEAYMI